MSPGCSNAARMARSALVRNDFRPGRIFLTRETCLSKASRSFTTTKLVKYAYPKEGVFQQNSPPNELTRQPNHPAPYMSNQSPLGAPFPPQFSPEQPSTSGATTRLPRILWLIFVAAGAGFMVMLGRELILQGAEQAMPLPLKPDSAEDVEELDLLFREYESIPLVQFLRKQTYEKGGDQVRVWQEWSAYQGIKDSPSQREYHFSTGPLRGSAGVGAQMVFWNERTQQIKVFINFGEAVTGWPGVIHGGIIATIFDEALGRLAIRTSEQKTAVTAHLSVNYMTKCVPGQWYVVHAFMTPTEESTDRKKHVEGIMACVNDEPAVTDAVYATSPGIHVHATASGLFVVPKQVQLKPIVDKF